MSLLLLLAGADATTGPATVTCEAAFGDAPLSTPTYDVDLSSRLERVWWTLGRTRGLSDWLPSGFSIDFDNSDRELDPEYTSGTYYGDLVPRVPMRIQVAYNSTTYDLLHGFAGEDGWQQTYLPPSVAECRVRCVDLLGVLAGIGLDSNYQMAVLGTSSVQHYWQLNDDTSATGAAEMVAGVDGDYRNEPDVTSSELVLNYPARSFNGTNQAVDIPDHAARLGLTALHGNAIAIEFWFRTSTAAASGIDLMFAQSGESGTLVDVGINSSGQLVTRFNSSGPYAAGEAYTTTATVDDGEVHHVIVHWYVQGSPISSHYNLIVLDGETQTTTWSTGLPSKSYGMALGGNANKTASNGFTGDLAHVALYEYTFTSTPSDSPGFPDGAEHHAAGIAPWSGDGTGERIANVLDAAGVPAGLIDTDPGLTKLGPAELHGRTALDYITQSARTEQGVLTVAHWDAGQVHFIDRAAILTATRHTTSQATFTDKAADLDPGEYRYDPDIVVEPASINSVINQVTVNYPDGTIILEDEASIAAHGPRGQTFDTLHNTAADVRSYAKYVLGRYKDPITRVHQLTLDCAACPANLEAGLTLRVGDRVTVERTPQNIGNTITDEYLIEGISGEIAGGVNVFRVTYYLSPADTKVYGLWGVGTWGSALWAH